MPVTHIIHDVDRDGLGSAAMMCAALGAESVRLHPSKSKDLRRIWASLAAEVASAPAVMSPTAPSPTSSTSASTTPSTTPSTGPHAPAEPLRVLVLDIPAPRRWTDVPAELSVTWVDHHMAAWGTAVPGHVEAVLPDSDRPTTTMSLLVKHGLARLPGVLDYVRALCGAEPDFEWGLVFDTLGRTFPRWPIEVAALPGLLAGGPGGAPVPEALLPLAQQARDARDTVRRLLDAAPMEVHPGVVVVELARAEGIPLAQFSLEAQRRHPGRAAVLVHRNRALYCGRASGRPGPDLVQHFRARGLDPKGHPYVVTVQVPRDRIPDERRAVVKAFGV